MRGIDYARLNVLKKVNSMLPDDRKMVFYFLHAKMYINYEDRYHGGDLGYYNYKRDYEEFFTYIQEEFRVLNREREIHAVYDENGSIMINNVPVNRFEFFDMLIDNDKQVNLENIRQCYWYQIGNSGLSYGQITLYYNKYFLIILPKYKSHKFLISLDPMIALKKKTFLFDSNNNLNLEMFDDVLESFQKHQTSINESALRLVLQFVEK